MLDFLLLEIDEWTDSHLLAENLVEMALGIAHVLEHVLECDAPLYVFIHEVLGSDDDGVLLGIGEQGDGVSSSTELAEVAHGGKIVVKEGRDVAEVFEFRALLEGGKHLLEDVISFADAGIEGDIDGLRGLRSFRIDGSVFPLEMHPVDGPVAIGICSVCMRDSHGQDDILVALDVVHLTIDCAPSTAVGAIDQYILVDTFGAIAIVVLRHGIEANISDIEIVYQWVDGFQGNGLG